MMERLGNYNSMQHLQNSQNEQFYCQSTWSLKHTVIQIIGERRHADIQTVSIKQEEF